MFAKYLFFIYRKSGERTGITYPDGRKVHYGYDGQVRLSEMREGDRVITYTYDAFGRLAQKKFPNGTESAYTYDSKGQLTELVHRDREGVSDRYTYLYDLTGNKTGITKERRGLETESGACAYGYDALGRLTGIQKDGQMQTRYGYDAFGNRVLKEDRAGRTTYCHNALNQLITEIREGADPVNKSFAYDKRGNLTRITENGQMAQQYVYGALNRLEEAVNGAGKAAKYQYNGLGHRVGKLEGTLSKGHLEGLDPQNRIKAGTEIGNWNQIRYTIDLTREYHNLLEKTEGEKRQTYFWDGNVASYEENGRQSYYLQDELGSPIRIEDETGAVRESYGYGAFGEDLYGNQGEMQPFGYTGYQRDKVAGTYYAQAREYHPGLARFVERDIIAGIVEEPFTLNRYTYCFNTPIMMIDLDGAWPQWIENAGKALEKGVKKVGNWISEHKAQIISGIAIVGAGIFVGATGGLGAGIIASGIVGIGGTVSGAINIADGGGFWNGFAGGCVGTALITIGMPAWGAAPVGTATTTIFDNLDDGKEWYTDLSEGVIQSAALGWLSPFNKLISMAGIKSHSLLDAFVGYLVQVYEGAADLVITMVEILIKNLMDGEKYKEVVACD